MAISAVLGAQEAQVYLTPFAGYYISSDLYSTTGAYVSMNDTFMYGGRLTVMPNRAVGIEFAYSRTGSDATLNRYLVGQPHQNVGHVDIDNYDINFLSFQRTGSPGVKPFGLIGFGWATTHPKIDPSFITNVNLQPQSHTNFNFNFALGTTVAMGERFNLRLEARWRVMDTNIQTSGGLWCDPYGYCYNYSSTWYDSGELIGGIGIRLK